MATENFPTLSRGPRYEPFRQGLSYDPTLRMRPEDGNVMTRSRATSLKRKFELQYDQLLDADYTLLVVFQETVMVGAEAFNWTHEKTSVSIECRLLKPIEFGIDNGNSTLWTATLALEEV